MTIRFSKLIHNLFIPHSGNNHKAKILHHSSLSKLIILILIFQLFITSFVKAKPGVLGYASNISAQKVLELTNNNRRSQGLSDLTFNTSLSDSATRKANDMFAKGYWAHNAPDGTTPWFFFQQVGYNYLYAGENLARDFGDSENVVKAWMDSPTHRDNILSGRYTEIGIAVVNGKLNDQETTLVVQHFGKPTTVAPQVDQESAVSPLKKEELVQSETVENELAKPEVVPINNISEREIYQVTGETDKPVFSSFDLTKDVNIALSIIVILVLVLDGFLIFYKKIDRRSGKSFIHLALFSMVMIILILSGSGRII